VRYIISDINRPNAPYHPTLLAFPAAGVHPYRLVSGVALGECEAYV